MWDTNSRLIRNFDLLRLPAEQRERWALRPATWAEYSDDERRRWREWFEWATAEGGELWERVGRRANLTAALLGGADLSRISLRGARLDRANLTTANLSQADLTDADLSSAKLEGASLVRARLTGATLSNARLGKADFTGADLSGATLHQTDLTGVDFKDARLFGTRITEPTWWVALPSATRAGETLFQQGIPEHPIQDVMGLPPLLRRQIADVQYLRDLHRKLGPAGRRLMWLWGITCSYGQSVVRWSLVSALIAVFFAVLYMFTLLNMPYHHLEKGQLVGTVQQPDFGRALYFSISTLMTLGLGDEVPITTVGRVITSVEVVLGYVMLGGLLSILANKLARLS